MWSLLRSRYTFVIGISLLVVHVPVQSQVKKIFHQNDGGCARCHQLLHDCLPILRDWFITEQKKDPTLHIMTTYRSEKQQNNAYKTRASRVQWGKSAHNYLPCMAIDLCFFVDGKSTQIPAKYKAMTHRLPDTIENGSVFEGLVDWCHFQVKNWQTMVENYPNGNKTRN